MIQYQYFVQTYMLIITIIKIDSVNTQRQVYQTYSVLIQNALSNPDTHT